MPIREDQISDRLDNENNYTDKARQLQDQENGSYSSAGTDQAEAYANDPNNATKNINETSSREAAGSGWTQNFTGKNKKTNKFKLTKKKGPLGIIAALILGGGFGFSMLMVPGLGIVHMKEVLTEGLSDHMGAVTVRQDKLLRAKLKKVQAGGSICSNVVTIRCKFGTMSKREVERFRKAGFTDVETTKNKLGRQRITKMTAPSGEVINNPLDILNSKDPKLRGDLNRAMNPKFLSFLNPTGWASRLGITKAPRLEGNSKKELDKSFDKATSGETYDAGTKTRTVHTDENGDSYVEKDGQRIYSTDPGYQAASTEQVTTKAAELAKNADSGGHAKNFLKSAGKGLAVTGAVDTACTVHNTARAVSAAAKVVRSAQLASFAMVFLNTADKIKSGDADPEEVSYLGDNLTYVDQRKTISDEKTIEATNNPESIELGERANPYYGKSAFDSAGYHVGAFNDAPILNSRDMQFTVGGALMGTFSPVTAAVVNTLGSNPEKIRKSCEVIQSWWVRGAGLAAGLVIGFGSFGWGSAALIGASVAVGFALPFLTAALADILAGKVVDSDTKGVDSGNAVFAGTAVLNGEIAKDYGMKPASKEDFTSYLASVQDVERRRIETERVLAQSTPFDIYNKYSFLGSLSRSAFPMALEVRQQPIMALLSSPLKLSGMLANLSVDAQAASTEKFNEERFERCKDDGYDMLGIDADVFCNVRYSMSDKELAMDPVVNAQWMVDNNHITPEGEPESDEYKEWVEFCAEREDGWGETSEEEGGNLGKNCVDDSDPYPHFRVFRMDEQIDMSMSGENTQSLASESGDNSSSAVTGDAQELAQKLLDNPKVTYWDQPQDAQDESRPSDNLRSIANGEQANTSTRGPATNRKSPIDVNLLKFLVDLASKTSFSINSLVGQSHSTGSNHYSGVAVDFGCSIPNGSITLSEIDSIANKYGVTRFTGEKCPDHAHWHYSVGGN